MERLSPYERADRLFKKIGDSPRFGDELREMERAIQFDPSDAGPFYVSVHRGKIAVEKGRKYAPDFAAGLYVQADRDALDALFQGQMTLAEAIYHHRLRIKGYRNREPLMVWFSKLLRRGAAMID